MSKVASPNNTTLIVVPCILFGTSLLVFAARIHTRLTSRLFALDDVFLTIAVLFGIAYFVLYQMNVYYGLENFLNLTVQQKVPYTRTAWLFLFCYAPCTAFTRISIVWQLRRIQQYSKAWRIGLSVLIFANLVIMLCEIVFNFTYCRPFTVNWNISIVSYSCISANQMLAWSIVFVAWPAISDAVTALLPLLFIKSMALDRREKIILAFVMGLGLFCAFATLPRLIALSDFMDFTSVAVDREMTIAWTFWQTVETCVGIAVVSAPPLRKKIGPYLMFVKSMFTGGSRTKSSEEGKGATESNPKKRPSPTDLCLNENKTDMEWSEGKTEISFQDV